MHLKVEFIIILHLNKVCVCILIASIKAWPPSHHHCSLDRTGPVRRQHHVFKVRADANTTGCGCTTDVFHVDSGPILAALKWWSTRSLVDHQSVRFCKIEVHLHEAFPGPGETHHTCLALLMVEILHHLINSLQNNLYTWFCAPFNGAGFQP